MVRYDDDYENDFDYRYDEDMPVFRLREQRTRKECVVQKCIIILPIKHGRLAERSHLFSHAMCVMQLEGGGGVSLGGFESHLPARSFWNVYRSTAVDLTTPPPQGLGRNKSETGD